MIVIRSTAIRSHRDENCGIKRNWVGGSGEWKSLEAELGRLSGGSEDCFGLGERKESGKGDEISVSVTRFMTHFKELVSLYCVLLCDCGRGDGLGFAGFGFRFRWSSGRPLLCSFRNGFSRK